MKTNHNIRTIDRNNLKEFLQKIDSFDKRMEELKFAIGSIDICKQKLK